MPAAEIFGLPKITITFKTKSTTAITRSARGIVVLILNDTNATNAFAYYQIDDVTDIPDTGITDANKDLITKCLLGTPYRVHVYLIPPAATGDDAPTITQATVLREVKDMKFNYIAHPTGGAADQTSLASWVKAQRANRDKTFKAVVANNAADSYGVINFTTGGIKVNNPDTTPQYITYSAAEYTARIAGILAGLSLDRSATYYELPEVVSCDTYEDIDTAINSGQLCLVDAKDGNGVKIARACNSLQTFSTDVGNDFRFIKIVEALDMIKDDIRDTFNSDYAGKVINDYQHKLLLIAAIHVYFNGLKGNVLDASPLVENFVEIDTDKQRDYIKLHGKDDPADMTLAQIEQYNTGTEVFLRGKIQPVNAMEDLTLEFVL